MTLQHPTAAWDLLSFLSNLGDYAETIFGVLLMILGSILIFMAALKAFQKLTGDQQKASQISWVIIVVMVIVGGGLFIGGWDLMSTIASGGQQTIYDIGGGK